MQNNKLNYNKLLFEFISVSFAIMFALFVDQWRESYNNQQLANKAIYSIREEVTENKLLIKEFTPNHQLKLHYLDSLIEVQKNSGIKVDTVKSIEVTLLSSSAWEMSKITNAIYYIDFETTNNIAKVYKLQSYYESIVKQYIINSSNSIADESSLIALSSGKKFLETIIPIEKDLSLYYGLILDTELTKKQ